MASRFTSSKAGTYEGGSKDKDDQELLRQLEKETKPEDPAEAAAKVGMYGHLTRSVLPFYPTRLLCKRFNVRPPANVVVDPGDDVQGAEQKKEVKEMVPRKAIERMMQDVALRRFQSGGFEGGEASKPKTGEGSSGIATPFEEKAEVEAVVDAEVNEALEKERPGDAVFKAIFGSDDEDD